LRDHETIFKQPLLAHNRAFLLYDIMNGDNKLKNLAQDPSGWGEKKAGGAQSNGNPQRSSSSRIDLPQKKKETK
jgi:hypothetical protein